MSTVRTHRPLLVRILCGLAIAASISVLSSQANAAPVSSPLPTASPVVAPAARPCTQERQVADEIIRRLRRLGLNFSHGRIPRPYDPDGELC